VRARGVYLAGKSQGSPSCMRGRVLPRRAPRGRSQGRLDGPSRRSLACIHRLFVPC
jgi:hypothetical protein